MAEAEKLYMALLERIDRLSKRWCYRYTTLKEYRADIGEFAWWANSYQKDLSEILKEAKRLYEAKKISYDDYSSIYAHVQTHIDMIKEETKMAINERLEEIAEKWKTI